MSTSPEQHHSISGERRPDIVVECTRPGQQGCWMFFDAKYRASRESLAKGFESVHIYRDSLRWPVNGGKSSSGFLLAPTMHEATTLWFSRAFREEHACGCFELRPGVDSSAVISALLDHFQLAP